MTQTEAVVKVLHPLSIIPSMFKRFCEVDFNVFLCATEEELEEELEWACNRNSSRAALGRINPDDYENRFRNSLTEWEWNNVVAYSTKYPKKVYQLNQYAATGHQIVSGEKELQTVVKNCGLLFNDVAGRWFLPKEVLVAQGFPVLGLGLRLPLASSYQVARRVPRSRAHMFERAGNSMNVACVGNIIVYKYAFVEQAWDASLALVGQKECNLKRKLG